MVSLTKLLPWLSIRSKLIIAFTGLSIIPVALVGLHGIFSNVKMMKEIAFENLSYDVQTIREKTANFLENIETDLVLLRNSSSLKTLERHLEKAPTGTQEELVQALGSEFLNFARTKGIYYRVRVIDERGDELLRVECVDGSSRVRGYRIVPEDELRSAGESYYFHLLRGSEPGNITFIPAELVDRNNDRVPVISFAMSIATPKRQVGILIADVFAKDLFQVVEIKRHLNVDGRVVLVRSDGHYLYHSEKKKDWNKLLASREEDNLYNEYPSTIVTTLLSGNEGTITDGVSDIISYAPLLSKRIVGRDGSGAAELRVPLFVFESVPKDLVLSPVRSFAWTFAAFLLIFLGTAIGLGLLATRQFTNPISALQRGAEVIAKGNYGHRLHVDTHDEIEKLAAQFNSMAASLEAHELELQRHKTTLEDMVDQRTQELSEQKTKLQAILDNVPSAFVLLDKEYRIQTASAAFAAVTGKQLENVRGADCSEVFCGNGFCSECVSRKAVQSGQAESHIDHLQDAKSGDRFIEHVAIPMGTDGITGSILEIITDVTRRKRFEQHLVQTERLLAAGEMSALIAHEFRNALTSIKMILQLQKESNRRTRSEQKSLGVALNSIFHMEQVVTEMLNFSRPSPMAFRTESIGVIIDESLKLVKMHADGRRIQLKTNVEPAIPPIQCDASRLREAFVNMFLNAIQAIEGKTTHAVREEVSITVKKTLLRRTLREFNLSDLTDRADGNNSGNGKEIVLVKGSECALIEIHDTGPGVPQALGHRVFDPFFTTKTNGTGLGLPMVKQTVNAHGGIVMLRSTRGEGATFRIYLPIQALSLS